MTFNLFCIGLATVVTGIAGFLVGAYFIEQKLKKSGEGKEWNTDPAVPCPHFEAAMAKGYADLRVVAEHERRKMHVKTWAENKLEREQRSGIVIDPGGQCLCRRCGHTVSALYDHCDNCNSIVNWKA